MTQISYDEALKQFKDILNFNELCAISNEVYDMAFAIKERKDIPEKEKFDVTKKALIKLGTMADINGKLFLESAEKYKSLIQKMDTE